MRQQFTFYRSFWEAVQELPQKDKTAVLSAICAYALDDTLPSLTGVSKAIFALIKPTLDTASKKAEIGKLGGSKPKANDKQTESKQQANDKLNASKKEKEKEIEIEKEIDIKNECYKPLSPFDRFWSAYPKKVGKDAARKAFAKVKVPIEVLLSAVEAQKRSAQWTKDNGQFIPNPATWLNQGRWEDELETAKPKGSSSMDYGDQTANMERMRKMIASMGGAK